MSAIAPMLSPPQSSATRGGLGTDARCVPTVRTQMRQQASAHARLSFGTAPALCAALCLAAGMLAAAQWWFSPPYLLLAIVFLVPLTAIAAARAPRLVMAPLILLFASLGVLSAELQPPVDPQQALAVLADGTEQSVTGEVVRVEPVRHSTYTAFFGHKTHDEMSQRLDLQLSAAGGRAISGGLRLTVYAPIGAPIPRLACGTRLQVAVAMHPEGRYLDPGVWDTSAYLHEQGIGALGSTAAEKVMLLGQGRPTPGCWIHTLQALASARILALPGLASEAALPAILRLSDQDASMLTAMLTGDRTSLQHATRLGFERTGSFHLLVVSGMHLAIFAAVIFVIGRHLRLGEAPATALTLLLSLGYAIFTGFGEPVKRSLCMVALFLLGRLIFRRRYALQALGLASLFLLAANPRALLGSSLQMTLLSVVAIGGIAAGVLEQTLGPYLQATRALWLLPLDPALAPRLAQHRVTLRLVCEHLTPLTGRWFARRAVPWLLRIGLQAAELLLISLIVELVMAMPMAVYFHRITVLSLPVNFLIVPFLGLLLPSALLTFATLLVWPPAAVLPASAAAGLLHVVSSIVTFFSQMHGGDYRIPAPPPARIAAWLLLLALAVYFSRRGRAGVAASVAMLLLATALAVAPQPVRHRAGSLEVTAIDVGQGDSLLIITPDGRSLLVDAGGIAGAPETSSFNMGEDVVSPVLWSRGIRRLDAVAITHAHADHIGGMAAVLANFHPRELWVGNNPPSREYDVVRNEAAQLGIPLIPRRAGDRWQLGAAEIRALWPSPAYKPRAEPTNNDSLVLYLRYGATSALLEGDAEAPAEAAMLAAGLPHADLLKVGHHGSRSSTIPPFLAAVAPEYAAISVGRKNFYGHPRHEILEELQGAHALTYRTDLLGASSFFLDGRHLTAEPWAGTPGAAE